jgi:hypothetical protein
MLVYDCTCHCPLKLSSRHLQIDASSMDGKHTRARLVFPAGQHQLGSAPCKALELRSGKKMHSVVALPVCQCDACQYPSHPVQVRCEHLRGLDSPRHTLLPVCCSGHDMPRYPERDIRTVHRTGLPHPWSHCCATFRGSRVR